MTSPQNTPVGSPRSFSDTPDYCLSRQYSEIAVEATHLFAAEFRECRTTGLCPLPQFTFILTWRVQCSFDTQEVEVMNHKLHEMSRPAGLVAAGTGARSGTVAAALGNRTRKQIYSFLWQFVEWLTLEQAAADVQSLRRHKLMRAGLANRKVAVPSDVAGEDEVLHAENADGELPLEKWQASIIAEGEQTNTGDDDLSETLPDTFAHDPCEHDEHGSEKEPLVANAEGSSSSVAGEVVATSGVGLDDVSVSKLRQACAKRSASGQEARVPATSKLSAPTRRVEHEGAGFCPRTSTTESHTTLRL